MLCSPLMTARSVPTPMADCGDGDTELDAAQARHLISKAIASALNSLLGMKPCAGPASIS